MSIWLISFNDANVHGAIGEESLFTIELKQMSIPDALKQLNEATGVPIVLRKSSERRIFGKSYEGQSLRYIFKDLLRYTDHILRWNYNNNDLVSVEIWIFDAKADRDNKVEPQKPNERRQAPPERVAE